MAPAKCGVLVMLRSVAEGRRRKKFDDRLFARGHDGSHEGDSRPAEAAIGWLTNACSDARRLEGSKGRGILE